MPRPVCGDCKKEMRLTRSVLVQFDALAAGGAYEQWRADEAVCGACAHTVIFRYAQRPTWQVHEQNRPGGVPPAKADYIIKETHHA